MAAIKETTEYPLTTLDAARLGGVSCETLRYWERRGLLKARRTPGGQRRWSPGDVLRVASEREERRRAG